MASKETAESPVILSLKKKNEHTTNEVLFCCIFKSAFFFRSLYIFYRWGRSIMQCMTALFSNNFSVEQLISV